MNKLPIPATALDQHVIVLGNTAPNSKHCTRCRLDKPLSAFGSQYNKVRDKRYRRPHCRQCDVDIAMRYRKTPAGKKARQIEHRRRFDRLYTFYRAIKAGAKCCCCGESEPACIDFHHLLGKSDGRRAISEAVHCSVKRIVTELRKCVAICSNCHRKHHAKKLDLPTDVKPISTQVLMQAARLAGIEVEVSRNV